VLELSEDGGQTRVHYTGTANVRGTLARVGARVMQPAAKMVVGQFFDCLGSKANDGSQAT
jgi:carbon monoxide dehydrogenase subunit G